MGVCTKIGHFWPIFSPNINIFERNQFYMIITTVLHVLCSLQLEISKNAYLRPKIPRKTDFLRKKLDKRAQKIARKKSKNPFSRQQQNYITDIFSKFGHKNIKNVGGVVFLVTYTLQNEQTEIIAILSLFRGIFGLKEAF